MSSAERSSTERSSAEPMPTPARPPGRGGPFAGMGIPVKKAKQFRPSARRLLAQLRPEQGKLLAVVALAILAVACSVTGPRLLGQATNIVFSGVVSKSLPPGATQVDIIARLRATGHGARADMLGGMKLTPGHGVDFTALAHLLWLTLALYACAATFTWAQTWLLSGIVQRTVYTLRETVEAKLHRLPLQYFDANKRGEVLSRVTNDVDNIAQSLQQTISQLITSVLTVVGVVAMMFALSWVMALIALVTVPLTIGITAFIAKRSQKLFVAQWAHTGELNGQIEEMYSGHALVKVFGQQRAVAERFAAKNEALFQTGMGAQFISGLIMPAMTFVGNLIYVAIAVVGGILVASGSLQVGDVQAFIQYSRQFTQPLAQLGSMANLLQSGVASAERVFEVLDADEERADPLDARSAETSRGQLAFEKVSFRYTPDKPLIEDLSLIAEPGHTIAIVGPTGAGKTTLVNLMMRFYEVDAGRITLDGVDIAQMTRRNLRSKMSMVLQDTWLFAGSIRDNIAYGRPEASEEDIVAAARAAYVDRLVHALPKGYDTMLDGEGGTLSTGELQLISIARAFLARPCVIILDEATSSVDTRTEVLVQKAMRALRANCTSFVIAHRLSTIRDADRILVMNTGRIVEQGTHTQLLAAGGAYHALYQAQFADVNA
ncbi:MAG TPA: ABC transporter ATP-binding protein [Steroidobacteraceae bacterium]|nr:ABC transporter ATP-binding protein [Steroidobacteraceae bacterium]